MSYRATDSQLSSLILTTLFHDGFVSLTHGFSAATTRKRPLLSPLNLRHGPRKENTFVYCRRVYSSLPSTGHGADHIEKLLLLSELLRNLATDCLPRICLRGSLFTNSLPSNVYTCNNITAKTVFMTLGLNVTPHWRSLHLGILQFCHRQYDHCGRVNW
jgi:hypothetical protein